MVPLDRQLLENALAKIRDRTDIDGFLFLANQDHRIFCRGLSRSGRTALHTAAFEGVTELIPFICKHCDPSVRDCLGITPLHDAARQGYVDVVAALLDVGAEVNAVAGGNGGDTPIFLATLGRRVELYDLVIQLLLDGDAYMDIHTLIRLGLISEAVQMLKSDANAFNRAVRPDEILRAAVTCIPPSKVQQIPELLELLVVQGADPNSPYFDPVLMSIAANPECDIGILQMLLGFGANALFSNREECVLQLAAESAKSPEFLSVLQNAAAKEFQRQMEFCHNKEGGGA